MTSKGDDPAQVLSAVSYTYDADGTLAATVVDGYPTLPQGSSTKAIADGVADYVVRSVALPDGSRWVESLDFKAIVNDPVRGATAGGKLNKAGVLGAIAEARRCRS